MPASEISALNAQELIALEDRFGAHNYHPLDVVIEVTDEMCPWNAGRWRVRGSGPVLAGPGTTPGAGTAECERTSADPDVILPAATLGAAYLGGTSLGTLARAGLATEVRGGALAALSAALSWDPAPWCPTIF